MVINEKGGLVRGVVREDLPISWYSIRVLKKEKNQSGKGQGGNKGAGKCQAIGVGTCLGHSRNKEEAKVAKKRHQR